MKQIILTGERAAGKTTFCRSLICLAEKEGLTLSGVLTITERENRLITRNLSTREEKELALYSPRNPKEIAEIQTPRWHFFRDCLEWGNRYMDEDPPSDLFILDEAGILEFLKNSGWMSGMRRLDQNKDLLQIAVVRPELLKTAESRWPGSEVFTISPEGRRKEKVLLQDLIGFLKTEGY